MCDFVQSLVAKRGTPGPIVAPQIDDITKKVKIDVADFIGDVGTMMQLVNIINRVHTLPHRTKAKWCRLGNYIHVIPDTFLIIMENYFD